MRRLLPLLLFLTPLAVQAQRTPTVIQGTISSNLTLSSGTTYLLKGYVKVASGATLTIPAGTVIQGDFDSKGTLIVMRGARINAQGTAARPIVFTSAKPIGQRAAGDWGGIVLLGNARLNSGTANIEGIPTTEGAIHGGTDDADNSGVLSYVRIEYPGVALAPNNEINGLTFGSVGSGTQVDHVMVSYSGDDSFEWFGGTVNCKYLIAYGGVDDDFDTDNGFRGNLQFLYALRDPNVADAAGDSNGFESDNDATGSFAQPQTAATFSNVTLVGPKATPGTQISLFYGRALRLRRATLVSAYNSVIVGWPNGLYLENDRTARAASHDSLQFRNNIIAGATQAAYTNSAANIDPLAFLNATASANRTYPNNTDVLASGAFTLTTNNPVPTTSSPAASGAGFTNARLGNAFFTQTTYVGAFDPSASTRWDAGWANYDPQNITYTVGMVEEVFARAGVTFGGLYPNPAASASQVVFGLEQAQPVRLAVYDLMGRQVALLTEGVQAAGTHSATIDTANLAGGTYLVRFEAAGTAQTRTLTVAH